MGVVAVVAIALAACTQATPPAATSPGAQPAAATQPGVSAPAPTQPGVSTPAAAAKPPGVSTPAAAPTQPGASAPVAKKPGEVRTLVVGVPAMPVSMDKDYGHGNRMTWEAVPQCNYNPQTFKVIDYDEKQYGPLKPGLETALKGFKYLDYASGPQPFFFESWQLSPDGKSATIKIKPGIKSFYGNELTSDSVKWTVDRALALQVIGYFYFINILRVDTNKPVEVIDKYTFKINSVQTNELLQSLWTNSGVTVIDAEEAKKYATSADPWAKNWLATNGGCFSAYGVESWRPGDQVVFVKNPNYTLEPGKPFFDRVIYKVIPDPSVRLTALSTREVDIATDLTPEQLAQARTTPGVKVIAAKCNCNFFGYTNVDFKPWDNLKVRQAVNYVMPRKEIADKVFGGFATPWQCAYHCMYPGADPTLWPYGEEPNFDKARQLIAESGVPADQLTQQLSFSSAFPEEAESAELIKANLEKIGFKVTLNPMADGDYAAQSIAHKTPFGLWFDTYIQPDPVYQLTLSWYEPKTVNNYSNINDPEFQRLIDQCVSKLTLKERVDCTRPAQIRGLELAGYAWLVEPFFVLATRDDLDGFVAYNTKFTLFKDVFRRQ